MNEIVKKEFARITKILDKHGYINSKLGTLDDGQCGNWLFSCCDGDGKGFHSEHYVKGAQHRNYLCGVFKKGVMIWIDQARSVNVHCAENPDIKIAHFGNQDSRYSGGMWPTLEKGKWLVYHQMPDSAKPLIRETLKELLSEAYEAWKTVQRRDQLAKEIKARDAKKYAETIEQAWA